MLVLKKIVSFASGGSAGPAAPFPDAMPTDAMDVKRTTGSKARLASTFLADRSDRAKQRRLEGPAGCVAVDSSVEEAFFKLTNPYPRADLAAKASVSHSDKVGKATFALSGNIDSETTKFALDAALEYKRMELDAARPKSPVEPLVIGGLTTGHNSDLYADTSIGRVKVTRTLKGYRNVSAKGDFVVDFSITNKGSSDLRIDSVGVEVHSYQSFVCTKVEMVPSCGVAEKRKHFCRISDTAKRMYLSTFEMGEGKYLKLAPGELEAIKLSICARHQGRYTFAIRVSYSISAKSDSIVTDVIKDVCFAD